MQRHSHVRKLRGRRNGCALTLTAFRAGLSSVPHRLATGGEILHHVDSLLVVEDGVVVAFGPGRRTSTRMARPAYLYGGSALRRLRNGAVTGRPILATPGEVYKVGRLLGTSLDPFRTLCLATASGAKTQALGNRIGGLTQGRAADCVVRDPAATPRL